VLLVLEESAQTRTLWIRHLHGLDLSIVTSTSPLPGPYDPTSTVIFIGCAGHKALIDISGKKGEGASGAEL